MTGVECFREVDYLKQMAKIPYTVVIPAYNESQSIRKVLSELRLFSPEAEIIVVDDCSSDGTPDVVREFTGVRLIHHPVNRGAMAAAVTGLKVAAREVVVTVFAGAGKDSLWGTEKTGLGETAGKEIYPLPVPGACETGKSGPGEVRGGRTHALPIPGIYGADRFSPEEVTERDLITPYLAMLKEKIQLGPRRLADLSRAVVECGADLGVAYDGDADRLGVVDEKGQVIWGDLLMCLFWREILPRYPGAPAIVEVKCSQALVEEIARLGGRPFFYRTGHSLIKAKLKEIGAPFTGEMSGHLFFADEYYGFDDAFYATGRLFRILSSTEKTLAQLLENIPKYYSTAETRVPCAEEDKFAVVARLKEALRQCPEVGDFEWED